MRSIQDTKSKILETRIHEQDPDIEKGLALITNKTRRYPVRSDFEEKLTVKLII